MVHAMRSQGMTKIWLVSQMSAECWSLIRSPGWHCCQILDPATWSLLAMQQWCNGILWWVCHLFERISHPFLKPSADLAWRLVYELKVCQCHALLFELLMTLFFYCTSSQLSSLATPNQCLLMLWLVNQWVVSIWWCWKQVSSRRVICYKG